MWYPIYLNRLAILILIIFSVATIVGPNINYPANIDGMNKIRSKTYSIVVILFLFLIYDLVKRLDKFYIKCLITSL